MVSVPSGTSLGSVEDVTSTVAEEPDALVTWNVAWPPLMMRFPFIESHGCTCTSVHHW
jgi:hypothetical protein